MESKHPRLEINHVNNLIQEHIDNEPTLLLESFDEETGEAFLNEENVNPQLKTKGDGVSKSNMWYLDTGASNHMTGDK